MKAIRITLLFFIIFLFGPAYGQHTYQQVISANSTVGVPVVFTPLDLGVKLLRWIHPNDATQVTEAGGIVSAIADKGTKNDNVLAEGSPTIASGEVVLDGIDQAFEFSTLLSTETDSEFFWVIKASLGFNITMSDHGATTRYMILGVNSGLSGQVSTLSPQVNVRVASNDLVFEDNEVNNAMSMLNYRTTGSAFVIGVNGTENSNKKVHAGSDSGNWTGDVTSPTKSYIGRLHRSSGSSYYAGTLGKAGFIETAPLTTGERTDLIDWMKTESGL